MKECDGNERDESSPAGAVGRYMNRDRRRLKENKRLKEVCTADKGGWRKGVAWEAIVVRLSIFCVHHSTLKRKRQLA